MMATPEYGTEISRLFTTAGPVVSLYLDLSGRVENAAAHIGLRWREMRDALAGQEAAPADLDTLDAETCPPERAE